MEGLIMNGQPVIQRMGRGNSNLRDESRLENSQMVRKEYEVVTRFESPNQYFEKYPTFLVEGTIMKVQLPEGAGSRFIPITCCWTASRLSKRIFYTATGRIARTPIRS